MLAGVESRLFGCGSFSELRAVYVGARRTTLRLEPVIWDALAVIAKEQARAMHDLLPEITGRDSDPNLSSAVRVYVIEYYRSKLRSAETTVWD